MNNRDHYRISSVLTELNYDYCTGLTYIPPVSIEKLNYITKMSCIGCLYLSTILDTLTSLQSQITALSGFVNYKGTWNASTNTPTLVSSVGTKGDYYVISVTGSTNLNGITTWTQGDWAIFNGTAWEKVDNTDLVTSVAGRTGAVTLTTADISGLGTIATQAASNVSITGGSITGITDLAVADGGTGASTAGNALTNLGAYPSANPSGFTSNTGTVTSVAATAGTGISVTGSSITTSGTLTITNTAPDQTVALTSGTGITTSGTYPNFTITNSGVTSAVAGTGMPSDGGGFGSGSSTGSQWRTSLGSGCGGGVGGTGRGDSGSGGGWR